MNYSVLAELGHSAEAGFHYSAPDSKVLLTELLATTAAASLLPLLPHDVTFDFILGKYTTVTSTVFTTVPSLFILKRFPVMAMYFCIDFDWAFRALSND